MAYLHGPLTKAELLAVLFKAFVKRWAHMCFPVLTVLSLSSDLENISKKNHSCQTLDFFLLNLKRISEMWSTSEWPPLCFLKLLCCGAFTCCQWQLSLPKEFAVALLDCQGSDLTFPVSACMFFFVPLLFFFYFSSSYPILCHCITSHFLLSYADLPQPPSASSVLPHSVYYNLNRIQTLSTDINSLTWYCFSESHRW